MDKLKKIDDLVRSGYYACDAREKSIKDLIERVNYLTKKVEELEYKLIYANIK